VADAGHVTCLVVNILKVVQHGQHQYGADVDWGVLDRVHKTTHWRHLANTIEHPCAATNNAGLCQITLMKSS